MAGIDAVVGKLVEMLVESLRGPIEKQMRYLCCYSCNVQTLADEVEELNNKLQSVQQDVDTARANSEVITSEVETWLKKVEALKTRSGEIRGHAEEVKRSCLCKWFPVLHYSLSRNALKTTNDSAQLRKREFHIIVAPAAIPPFPAAIPPVPNTSITGFESRVYIENKIMNALKDPSVYSIGIWGMGGVGKTVMAKNIEKEMREKVVFKHVVMVVVSQPQDLRKIQSQIAEAFRWSLTAESLELRSRELHGNLVNKNGILIILDDIWDKLDLKEIGIPSQSTRAGCKLILTSRNRDALRFTGVIDGNIFQLGILTEEESWKFFKDNADIDDSQHELVQIAKKVERECMGLPLALKIVACALKDKSIAVWNNAVRELEKHAPDNILDVTKHVYGPLLYSINALEEGKAQKDLFLLCCLFPEDYLISIEELLGCAMGLGIFGVLENLTEARYKVEAVLDILLSRSLLIKEEAVEERDEEDEEGDNFIVKMHDVIRDVGIWIVETKGIEKHKFLIKHEKKEWPTAEVNSSNDYTHISLLFSHDGIILSKSIVYPKLEFLRLDFLDRYVELPENFFDGMSELRVFEAFYIGLLPTSMDQLHNLRSLYLENCTNLERVSMLGNLFNLEMLNLRNCRFEVLPKEIGNLKKLTQMNILYCRSLRRIAYGVVSGLVRLEELVILDDFDNWEAEGGDVACLSELNGLKNLTTLKIVIGNPNVVPRQKPLWVQKLKKYGITVAHLNWDYVKGRFQKAILLGDGVANPMDDWIYNMASDDAEYVYLRGCNCLKFVKGISENSRNLSCLKQLRLSHFTSIQYLVEGQQNSAIFTALESLRIEDSTTLQQIFEVSPQTESFKVLQRIYLIELSGLVCLWKFSTNEQLNLSNLRKVEIESCDNLSYLFSLSVVQSLVQLTSLVVRSCRTIKEIFKKESRELEEINETRLPKLREINFEKLDSFYRLCNEIDRIELPELHVLNIDQILAEGDSNEVHQKYLISKVDNAEVSWISINFCVLRELRVHDIKNFKCMFSPSVISSGLPNLSSLSISNCSMLEEVIGKDNENVGRAIIFPNLVNLVLSNLWSIRTFCYNTIQFSSLKELHVDGCPLMLKFVGLIDDISSSKPFLDKQVVWGSSNFCRLQSLTVKRIGKIKCMFSLSFIISGLSNLQVLKVDNCSMLEQVIEKDEEENVGSAIIFPNLKSLMLRDLPNIRTFCYNAIQLPSLEILDVIKCPLMLKFVEEFTDYTSNSIPFLGTQVQCPKLKVLRLVGLNISGVFSPLFFKSLTILVTLNLENCEGLEHTITKEEGQTVTNTEEEFIQKIPLKIFNLIQLPKLCGSIFQIKHNLEFPLLERIKIEDCPMLEKFSLGSLRMPKLKRVRGLRNAELVAKFFSNKEMVFREIHSENNCFIISPKDISFTSNQELDFFVSKSSESFVDAVSIALNSLAKEVVGKFKIEKIRIGIEYEVMLMIMLLNDYEWKDPIEIELKLPEESKLQHTVTLENHPKDTWIEISVGKFVGEESQQNEQLEFSLRQLRNVFFRELFLKGIRIVEV